MTTIQLYGINFRTLRILPSARANPFLAPAPRKPKIAKPVNPRDLEIYRSHTEEKRTVSSLAEEFGLAEKSVWGICAKMRKRNLADGGQ